MMIGLLSPRSLFITYLDPLIQRDLMAIVCLCGPAARLARSRTWAFFGRFDQSLQLYSRCGESKGGRERERERAKRERERERASKRRQKESFGSCGDCQAQSRALLWLGLTKMWTLRLGLSLAGLLPGQSACEARVWASAVWKVTKEGLSLASSSL